jgi:hypothetical protein
LFGDDERGRGAVVVVEVVVVDVDVDVVVDVVGVAVWDAHCGWIDEKRSRFGPVGQSVGHLN